MMLKSLAVTLTSTSYVLCSGRLHNLDCKQGIFSQPIYGDGNYPQRVLDTIPASILPRLTAEDKALIKGSADFYAIDAYRTK